MPITREALEKRLKDAQDQLEVLKQQFASTMGVIADCDYWLKELDKPADPPAEVP